MSVYQIIFSPTGGTRQVADLVGKTVPFDDRIDLTDSKCDFSSFSFSTKDICFFFVPVYVGNLPAIVAERIAMMKGEGARAIAVVTYGNRDIGNTMIELCDVLEGASFACVAALKVVTENSMNRDFGHGRPDASDEEKLAGMLTSIMEKIDDGSFAKPQVPGERPYKLFRGTPMAAKAGQNCTRCGLCANGCPTGAIPEANPAKTDTKKCITCMRCIEICPESSRNLNRVIYNLVLAVMKKQCIVHKENALYL